MSRGILGNLYINGVEGVCTQARAGSRSEAFRFEVQGNSVYKLDVPVFPLKEGRHPLKIEAISTEGSDAIVKELYVVVSGVLRSKLFPNVLPTDGR